ncbi:hypothetical protein SAMN05216474_1077 [Lishizhenia tianjinensis]|uniref:AhpC/TSA family protein n=1 Tax=Lishizhenia tianjinensis TaxID=477690 RepID=A0A1I6YPM4_9FLAO|nr:hypothetical protein [Lishizhenia tianjinensis]SFT52476.1 hypothetical protein SAMN05216474_1077 [Lishizhenia tianjinensis]
MKSSWVKLLLETIVVALIMFFIFHPRGVKADDRIISEENIHSIIDKKLNLVYIFTDWCGACRETLHDFYGSKALKNKDLDVNIILIGANHAKKDEYLELKEASEIDLPIYLLENTDLLSLKAITDHPRIENFIKSNFTNYGELNFNGVPITFYADENLTIIGQGARTYNTLMQDVKRFKNSFDLE